MDKDCETCEFDRQIGNKSCGACLNHSKWQPKPSPVTFIKETIGGTIGLPRTVMSTTVPASDTVLTDEEIERLSKPTQDETDEMESMATIGLDQNDTESHGEYENRLIMLAGLFWRRRIAKAQDAHTRSEIAKRGWTPSEEVAAREDIIAVLEAELAQRDGEIQTGAVHRNALEIEINNLTAELANARTEQAGIRSEVLEFALEIEQKLKKHDNDRGSSWKYCPQYILTRQLLEHVRRFEVSPTREQEPDYTQLPDIANFCMMLWNREIAALRKV